MPFCLHKDSDPLIFPFIFIKRSLLSNPYSEFKIVTKVCCDLDPPLTHRWFFTKLQCSNFSDSERIAVCHKQTGRLHDVGHLRNNYQRNMYEGTRNQPPWIWLWLFQDLDTLRLWEGTLSWAAVVCVDIVEVKNYAKFLSLTSHALIFRTFFLVWPVWFESQYFSTPRFGKRKRSFSCYSGVVLSLSTLSTAYKLQHTFLQRPTILTILDKSSLQGKGGVTQIYPKKPTGTSSSKLHINARSASRCTKPRKQNRCVKS